MWLGREILAPVNLFQQPPDIKPFSFVLQDGSVSSLESSIRWADGFLLLYSITQRPSFLDVSRLKKLIDQTKQSLGEELMKETCRGSSDSDGRQIPKK